MIAYAQDVTSVAQNSDPNGNINDPTEQGV